MPSFTYDLTTSIGQVRLEINDKVEGSGVLPDGKNLTDEEIQVWLTREGTVLGAAAAACEFLSRAWAREADYTIGPRKESSSQISKAYSRTATELRELGGAGASAGSAFSVGFNRQDGYAEEAGGHEYS